MPRHTNVSADTEADHCGVPGGLYRPLIDKNGVADLLKR